MRFKSNFSKTVLGTALLELLQKHTEVFKFSSKVFYIQRVLLRINLLTLLCQYFFLGRFIILRCAHQRVTD